MKATFGVIFFSGSVSGRRYDVNSVGIDNAERVAYSLAGTVGGAAVPIQGVWRGEREDAWLLAMHGLQGEQLRAMAAGLARMFEQETVIFGELELEVENIQSVLSNPLATSDLVNSLDSVEVWTMVDGQDKTAAVATASDWLTYDQVEAVGLDGWTDINGEAFVIKF